MSAISSSPPGLEHRAAEVGVPARDEVEQGERGEPHDRRDEQDRDARAPGDVARRDQRRDRRAGDDRRHRADVGAEPAPRHRRTPALRRRPRTPRRACCDDAVASSAAEPQQADRGERDLELVARAEEARAQHGVRPEQRAPHEVGPEREVDDVQQHGHRGRHRERAVPRADAIGRQREHAAPHGHDQSLDRRSGSDCRGQQQDGRAATCAASSSGAARQPRVAAHRADEAGQQRRADQAQPDHRPAARARGR